MGKVKDLDFPRILLRIDDTFAAKTAANKTSMQFLHSTDRSNDA